MQTERRKYIHIDGAHFRNALGETQPIPSGIGELAMSQNARPATIFVRRAGREFSYSLGQRVLKKFLASGAIRILEDQP